MENLRPEQVLRNILYQRKVIAESLKNGSHPCLPGADGSIDTSPAINIMSGNRYHGASLLYLKDHQKRNGFPTAEYIRPEALKNADMSVRKGEHSVQINYQEKNEKTGEWEQKNIRLFNVTQTAKPWKVKEYAKQQQEAWEQERVAYLKSQYGTNWEPNTKEPGPDMAITSTEPERYLAQYFAAVSMGSKLTATSEQGKEFAQRCGELISECNIDGLSKLCNKAGILCKEVIREQRELQSNKQGAKQAKDAEFSHSEADAISNKREKGQTRDIDANAMLLLMKKWIPEENPDTEAELSLVEVLNSKNIPFIRLEQEQRTFSSVFREEGDKRPDYLLLTKPPVFVDVKQRRDKLTINKTELVKLQNLETNYNIPVWLAFTQPTETGKYKFIHISSIKSMETGNNDEKSLVEDNDSNLLDVDAFLEEVNKTRGSSGEFLKEVKQ
jgi:hypothetical protein